MEERCGKNPANGIIDWSVVKETLHFRVRKKRNEKREWGQKYKRQKNLFFEQSENRINVKNQNDSRRK